VAELRDCGDAILAGVDGGLGVGVAIGQKDPFQGLNRF
jgi:hypothetical protein